MLSGKVRGLVFIVVCVHVCDVHVDLRSVLQRDQIVAETFLDAGVRSVVKVAVSRIVFYEFFSADSQACLFPEEAKPVSVSL